MVKKNETLFLLIVNFMNACHNSSLNTATDKPNDTRNLLTCFIQRKGPLCMNLIKHTKQSISGIKKLKSNFIKKNMWLKLDTMFAMVALLHPNKLKKVLWKPFIFISRKF